VCVCVCVCVCFVVLCSYNCPFTRSQYILRIPILSWRCGRMRSLTLHTRTLARLGCAHLLTSTATAPNTGLTNGWPEMPSLGRRGKQSELVSWETSSQLVKRGWIQQQGRAEAVTIPAAVSSASQNGHSATSGRSQLPSMGAAAHRAVALHEHTPTAICTSRMLTSGKRGKRQVFKQFRVLSWKLFICDFVHS